jgi:hypothetical protein
VTREILLRPTMRVIDYQEGFSIPAQNLAHELTTYIGNLGAIVLGLVREGGSEG